MKKLKRLEERLLGGEKVVQMYCFGCGNTTKQHYITQREYSDFQQLVIYDCPGCRTTREYIVTIP